MSRMVGKELNSSGFLMKIDVIRMRMEKLIENDSVTSSSQAGSGSSRMTRMPRMPAASAISPFLR
jgi:hypothetical protein